MKSLLSLFILFGTFSYGQDTVQFSHLDKKPPTNFNQKMSYLYQGKPYTGVAVKGNSPNYTVIQHFTDGYMNGPYVAYYDNGQLKQRSNYVAGVRDGKYEYWYENGQKASDMKYKMGQIADTTRSWFQNGNLKSWEVIVPDQQYVDIADIYYSTGQKSYEVRPSYYKQYYENGKVREYGEIKDNVKIGKVKYYNEKGKLYKMEWYEEGKVIKAKEKPKNRPKN